jgi:putative flippase GtrA
MTFTDTLSRPTSTGRPVAGTALDIVIPVYNEQKDLPGAVTRLHEFLAVDFPWSATITIADNASTDLTWTIATQLAGRFPEVRAVHLDEKGRGRALKRTWLASDAQVCCYMDVDLSTDLRALAPLVAPLLSGHSELAIGSRLSKSSRVVRGPKREFISRTYNLILHGILGVSFSDAQCGFKAIRADVAQRLIPLIEDNNWFFDTEMLVLAQRAGMRIHEVPVDWVDDPDSTVHIVGTATEDLKGVARLMKGFISGSIPLARLRAGLAHDSGTAAGRPATAPKGLTGQLVSFGLVGVISTLAYYVIYLIARLMMGPQISNLLSLLITQIWNTSANRKHTFGLNSREGMLKHQASGLVAFGVGLALTSGSLWGLHHWAESAPRWTEVMVLLAANAIATLVRFITLRVVINQDSRRAADHPHPARVIPG